MKAGTSGGGFFFKPFNTTTVYQTFIATSSVVAFVYGNWAHLPIPKLTVAARWIVIQCFWTDPAGRAGLFQIGSGNPGSEVIYLPTNSETLAAAGNRGEFYYNIDINQPSVPYQISMPLKIDAGINLSVRHRCSKPGGVNLHVNIYTWD